MNSDRASRVLHTVRVLPFLLSLIALTAAAAAPAPAVDPATFVGNVYGSVTDAASVAVPGALVSVWDSGRLVCSGRTNDAGQFLINSIPTPFEGFNYDVTAELVSCGKSEVENVHILPGASMALEVSFVLPRCGVIAPEGPARSTTWRYRHEADSGPENTDARLQTQSFTRSIFSTREGLVGGTTANGHVIVQNDRFAALPSTRAISNKFGNPEQLVRVTYRDRSVVVPVWDIGPWNIHDDYWSPPSIRESFKDLPQGKPEAEAAFYDHYNNGLDERGRVVKTPAGIDLADGTFWIDLGMTNNDRVTVEYLWLDSSGPLAGGLSLSANPAATAIALAIDANVSDSETGNSPLAAAEVFVDTIGPSGSGIPASAADGAFDSSSESVHAVVSTSDWLPGSTHVIFVHGRDAYENWGPFISTTVSVARLPRMRSVRR